MHNELSESFFLSAGEVNAEGELLIPILTSKIIDIATAHANSLGIGNPAMAHLGLGWVLSRLTIEMRRWPKANETYTLTTWIESWNRHFSLRSFQISDPEGNALGYARSVWMVMDTRTRENAGLSHLTLPEGMTGSRECPIDRQAKHLAVVDIDSAEVNSRTTIRATRPAGHHTFQYCDLDFYRHVNTVRYVSLLLNQFPLEYHAKNVARRLELNFLHEAGYGEMLDILVAHDSEEEENSLASISLNDSTSGSPILFARLAFQKRR